MKWSLACFFCHLRILNMTYKMLQRTKLVSNYAALRLPWLFTCRPCDNVRMLSLPPPLHEILLFNVSLSPFPLWSFSWLGSQHPKNFVLSKHWFLVATVLFISRPLGYELLKSRRCHIYLWIPSTRHWVANKQINVWKNKLHSIMPNEWC